MKPPKFKIGQKVRIKEWKNMPEELYNTWGRAVCVGQIVTIEGLAPTDCDGYDVVFENGGGAFYLYGELESVIKVGEQLLFSFMEEE